MCLFLSFVYPNQFFSVASWWRGRQLNSKIVGKSGNFVNKLSAQYNSFSDFGNFFGNFQKF
jgi:hypothetical protein